MTAKTISIADFKDSYMAQAEADYEALLAVANRMVEAQELGQRERLYYMLKGTQQIIRKVFGIVPSKPDAIDRKLDELASFFADKQ